MVPRFTPAERFLKKVFDTNQNLVYSIPTMNNMIDTSSDLRDLITVDITETMTPEIELTDEELEAMDDIRFQNELSDTVAELVPATDEQNACYNDKMEFLANIRNEIPALNVVEANTEESYTVPSGRYDHIYTMGTI